MDDDTDDLVEMMRRIDRMNHEQRAIVGGVSRRYRRSMTMTPPVDGSNSTSNQSSTN